MLGNLYTPLSLIIMLHFTCGKKNFGKISKSVSKYYGHHCSFHILENRIVSNLQCQFFCFFSFGSFSKLSSLEYELACNTSLFIIFSQYLLSLCQSSKSLHHLSKKKKMLNISQIKSKRLTVGNTFLTMVRVTRRGL